MNQAKFTAEMMIALAKGNLENEIQAIVNNEPKMEDVSQLSYDIARFIIHECQPNDVRKQRLYIEAKVKKYIANEQ